MKIAFVYQWSAANARALERELAHMRELGTDITGLDLGQLLGYKLGVSDLDFQYCLRNPQVTGGLARLREASQSFQVIVIYGTLQIPPDFIRQAWSDRFVIYWATDDPVNSTVATLPYLSVADHVFSQTPRYLDSVPMPQWLLAMGAKSASYMPIGYFEDWKRGRSNQEILDHPKDIDISFVGSPSWRKDMLLDAKKVFGRKLKIFSRDWPFWRHVAYDALQKGVFHIVSRSNDESEVYFRSRLSINSNACSGPSTSRTFHIPICGALQLCDFPDGLSDIFELHRHVLPYDFVNAESLCQAIESALAQPARLEEQRVAGFWHVQQHYRFANLLSRRLSEVI